ncbi:hypothetical protein L484_023659 [Morus notabilis]|uniref:Uncharacterized protein n=1 Tax=Morus notabilis TaxID=981085 RepID=W9S5P4_9ROSA|nr:hypothetical protein L484_023659 [Morus notabilis]
MKLSSTVKRREMSACEWIKCIRVGGFPRGEDITVGLDYQCGTTLCAGDELGGAKHQGGGGRLRRRRGWSLWGGGMEVVDLAYLGKKIVDLAGGKRRAPPKVIVEVAGFADGLRLAAEYGVRLAGDFSDRGWTGLFARRHGWGSDDGGGGGCQEREGYDEGSVASAAVGLRRQGYGGGGGAETACLIGGDGVATVE